MKRLLVIRGGSIGDFILALPALGALRENYPVAHLEAMGNTTILALADRRYYLDAIRSSEWPGMARFYGTDRPLPEELVDYFRSFDLIVSSVADPTGVFKANLEQTGARRVLAMPPFPPRGSRDHVAQFLYDSLAPLGIRSRYAVPRVYLRHEDRRAATALWHRHGLDTDEGLVVAVHPGSGGRAKIWPADRFARLIDGLVAEYQARILMLSGPADETVVRNVLVQVSRIQPTVVAERPLPEVAAILGQADLYLGNDSGITHLAAAVGTPTIALFGPTDPLLWGPRGPAVRIIQASPPGLDNEQSPSPSLAMRAISEAEVFGVVAEMLAPEEGVEE